MSSSSIVLARFGLLASIVLALNFMSHSCIAQFGFEGTAPGSGSVTLTPNSEGWSSSGGLVTITPFGPIGANQSGFPSEGSQWAVVRSIGSTGGFATASGGPAAFPLPPGSTGNIQRLVTVPVASGAGGVMLNFDYNFVTPECASDSTWNDFMTVDLVDPATGLSVQNLLYIDTFSLSLVAGAVTPHEAGIVPGGFCGAALELSPLGTVQSLSVAVDPMLYGQNLSLQFHVGDGNDTGLNSYFYLDNVEFIGGMPPPTPMSAGITALGGGNFQLQIDAPQLTSVTGGYEIYTFLSALPAVPTGSGAFLGLNFDLLTADIVSFPLGLAPFHFQMVATPYIFGPFSVAPGLTLDYAVVALENNGVTGLMVAELTAAQSITF